MSRAVYANRGRAARRAEPGIWESGNLPLAEGLWVRRISAFQFSGGTPRTRAAARTLAELVDEADLVQGSRAAYTSRCRASASVLADVRSQLCDQRYVSYV